jgi:prepilin-type N-terminal cleavage/methylation domain-containing protein
VSVSPPCIRRLPDRFFSSAHGFTLLEVSVVVVIISVVTSLAVPIVKPASREARSTTVVTPPAVDQATA